MSLLWSNDPARGKRLSFNPRPKIPATGWKLINEFPSLRGAKAIAFDVETYDPHIEDFGPGWARGVGHILGVAVGTNDGFRRYYPMRHVDGPNCHPEQVLDWLNTELSRPHQPKVGHNILYDLGWVAHEGVTVAGDIHCTWTAERLLDRSVPSSLEATGQRHVGEGKESNDLYEWAWQFWGKGKAKNETEKRKLCMKHLRNVPPELVGFYAESDVDLPLRICPIQYEKMDELGLLDVYHMECALLPLLVQMRLAGVRVDLAAAERAHDRISAEIGMLQKEIDHIAGKPLNTGAPTQVGPVFDRLGIKYPLTAKTKQPQLKAEFLKTLDHPLAIKIVEIEELKKMNSTFVEGYILESNINGKIYGEFNPMEAVTGRMSASNPNLQNIPSRTDLGKVVREIFVPDEGDVAIGKWDYSSVESRILAHFAVGVGSKALRKEYNQNPLTDYHDWTIRTVQRTTGILLERKPAKTISFGLGYGAMPPKLASMLGLTLEQAMPMFEAYHSGMPFVSATMKHMSEFAEENGYTRTILGRRAAFNHWEPRWTPKGAARLPALVFDQAIKIYGPNIKRAYLHKAVNYVIQGSAADLMKAAMVQCWKSGIFAATGVPRLVVHDELVFSVKDGYNRNDFIEMKNIMENAVKFKVPIRTEGEIGASWGKTEKF
jgi:DNA polymerase-1